MLWPAGSRNAIGLNPYRYPTSYLFSRYGLPSGAQRNRFIGETYSPVSSVPDGYGAQTYIPPKVSGGMASHQAGFSLDGTGNLLSGGPITGSGALSIVGGGGLSLVVSLSGTGSVTVSGTGNLSLTIGLSGNGDVTLTGTGGLSMIVPFSGDGAMSIAGQGDLRGLLSMSGNMTATDEVTPQTVAREVWAAVAAENDAPGSMGAFLVAAGAGGDPWAVTLEGTYTAADLIRIMAAVLAGKVSGMDAGNPVFRSVNDAEDRVEAVTTSDGNRTSVVVTP